MAGKKSAPERHPGRLRIIAKAKAGFYRAGVKHPATATDHEGGTFTVEQVELLKAEPMLVVQDLPPEEPEAA